MWLNLRQVKSRIMSIHPFEAEKEQSELRKLETLGDKFRFESEIENRFYGLGD